MNRQRAVLYLLLTVVAAAAAVLSFAALRDLAIVCGFAPSLAWLLPVVIDAGAAAGSLAWLGSAAPQARTYGRTLALLLLASSVGGNALGHGLAAYSVRPHWLVVVGVSAVAPAVLGALVHLVVLAARPAAADTLDGVDTRDAPILAATEEAAGQEAPELRTVADAVTARRALLHSVAEPTDLRSAPTAEVPIVDPDETDQEGPVAKAERLIAEGVGRPRLARELGIKDHQARALLAAPAEVRVLLPRYQEAANA